VLRKKGVFKERLFTVGKLNCTKSPQKFYRVCGNVTDDAIVNHNFGGADGDFRTFASVFANF